VLGPRLFSGDVCPASPGGCVCASLFVNTLRPSLCRRGRTEREGGGLRLSLYYTLLQVGVCGCIHTLSLKVTYTYFKENGFYYIFMVYLCFILMFIILSHSFSFFAMLPHDNSS